MLLGMHEASAYSSMAREITSYCSANGYSLLPVYESDTCDAACHNNTQGVTAYNAGNYEYFCPPPVVESPVCTDADGDGFFSEGDVCGTLADFDDGNSSAYPGATEICTDGIDNDGNGLVDTADPNAVGCTTVCTDMDGDGYSIEGGACGPIDCNDADGSVNPGASEICSDAVDNNCNGLTDTADMNAVGCPLTCTDADGDGYSIEGGSCGAMDCDDNNAEINPGALELCGDGVDNNCDARMDAADSVCQSTGGSGDDENDQPWWRSHRKNSKDKHQTKDDDHGDDRDESDRTRSKSQRNTHDD